MATEQEMHIDPARERAFRAHLEHRRQGLKAGIDESRGSERLIALLREVDTALERLNDGTYGICEICNGEIEPEHLAMDPLVRTCLSHLTEDQQRALERDLNLASGVQSRLLPRNNTSYDGWEICYHYEPAGPVSGDYCDIIAAENGGATFLLGDVSGKGVAASLLMSHLHATFRSLTPAIRTVEDLVSRVNGLFCDSALSGHFATLVCGMTMPSGAVYLCNAGHCPPLVARRGKVTEVEATGVPIGLFRSSAYTSIEARLNPGETLLLYTDGLSESLNPAGEEYGAGRVSGVLERHASASPRALLSACLDDLRQFTAGLPRLDDLTLMVVRHTA